MVILNSIEKKKSWMKKFRSILKLFNKIEKIEIQKSEKTNEQTTMFFYAQFFYIKHHLWRVRKILTLKNYFFFFKRKKLT